MATIVFHLLPQHGHLRPMFLLARTLQKRGHRIVFYVESDVHELVDSEGFEALAFLPRARPKGSQAAAARLSGTDLMSWWQEDVRSIWRACADGEDRDRLAALGADLLLGDVCRPFFRLVAAQLGVPFVRCAATLPGRYRPGEPPPWSDALPGELSPADVDLEWRAFQATRCEPLVRATSAFAIHDVVRVAARNGLDPGQIDWACATGFVVDSDPDLVPCSRAFEFPGPAAPEVTYLGPCLDDEPTERWSYPSRRPEAPLVFCSFGSMALRYPRARHFLRALFAAAHARPHLDVVIAVPDEVVQGEAVPPSVHVTSWVPQRALLTSTDVFITHAGLGSVKEALWEGVPMIAVPQAFDQRGNAARIVFHGLGRRFCTGDPSPGEVGAAVDALLADPSYRDAVTRMRKAFRRDRGVDRGVDVVESMLASDTAGVGVVSTTYRRGAERVAARLTGVAANRNARGQE